MKCIIIKFLDDSKFGGVVNMLEGRTATNRHHSPSETD